MRILNEYLVLTKEREHFLEIFKIQVDEIILHKVADRFLCLKNSSLPGKTLIHNKIPIFEADLDVLPNDIFLFEITE